MPSTAHQIEAIRQLATVARISHAAACARVRDAGCRPAAAAEAAAILREPPAHTTNLRVFKVLCAIPRVGPEHARRILATEHLHERHVLGRLTARQRYALANIIDPSEGRVAA